MTKDNHFFHFFFLNSSTISLQYSREKIGGYIYYEKNLLQKKNVYFCKSH